jgi:trimeric autotransporter adhesin
MKKLFILSILAVFGSYLSFGTPLTGTKTIGSGGNYATIAAAIADLNANGVGTGGVIFNIPGGYTETFTTKTAGLISTLTGSATNTITFQRSGPGANPLITAMNQVSGGGTTYDYIICIGGTDYLTIDGIDVQENTANMAGGSQTIINNQCMEWGYAVLRAFVSVGVYDGTQHLTIKNCNISLNRASTNATAGIYVFRSATIAPQTAVNVTNPEGANSYDVFYSNNISNCATGIYGYGSVNSAAWDLYNQYGTSTAGNLINNIGPTGTGTAQGIYLQYNNNFTIANNTISGTVPTNTFYGIQLQSTTNASMDMFGNTISIQFTPATGIYAFYGINNAMGAGTTSTQNIHDNLVTNCTYAIATNGSCYYLNFGSGGQNTNVYNNIVTNNTYGSAGATATGTIYGLFVSAFLSGTTTCNVYNNSVTNNSRIQSGVGGGTNYLMYLNMQSTTFNAYNNTIDNINLASSGTTYGLYCAATNPLTKNIYGNTITNLLNANGGTIWGIYLNGGKDYNVYKNKVQNLVNNSFSATTTAVAGMYVGMPGSAGNYYIYNNFIGDLKAPNSNCTNAVTGVYFYPYNTAGIGFYNNTIYLNASSAANDFGTSGLYIPKASNMGYSLTLINNIVDNLSTPKGAGKTCVILTDTLNLPLLTSSTNNNCYFAGTPSATHLIYTDGINSDQTMATFKARFNPRENKSLSENPPFLATTTPVNLHISTSLPSQCESGGSTISTPVNLTTDYDGDARYPNAGYPNNVLYPAVGPDIGADEFGGRPYDTLPPTIVYTPLLNTSNTSNRVLLATITDPHGVPTSGSGLARICWKKNYNGAWTYVAGSYVGNSQYSFSFGGGLSLGDSVYYFVVAQDGYTPANTGSYPSIGAGGFTANPPAAATPPINAYSYKIIGSICGTINVGVGKTYTTLTDAISDINSKEITCPITLVLTDSLYSASEVFPVTLTPNSGSSPTNTLTIRPLSGKSPIISGSSANGILKVNGFDYLIIDGSATGGTDKGLTIQNTANLNNAFTIGLFAMNGSDPATNVTIKNTIVKAAPSDVLTTSAIFTSALSGGYDNLVINNNTVTSAYQGIVLNGNASYINHNAQITNNIVGSADTTQYLYQNGIYVQYSDNTIIEGNEVMGAAKGDSVAFTPAGILINAGSTNTKVRKNIIHDWYNNMSDFDEVTGSGANGITYAAESGSVTEISNNVIYNIRAIGAAPGPSMWNPYGILILQGGNVKILHNSIHLSGHCLGDADHHDGSSACVCIRDINTRNIELRNNMFQNSMSTWVGNCYTDGGTFSIMAMATDASNFSVIDNNNYYGDGCNPGIAMLYATKVNTLSWWQSITGQDASSIVVDPMFVSATDLHPTNPAAEHQAVYLPLVPTDITGTARTNPTDMGAYQVSPSQSVQTNPATFITTSDAHLQGGIFPKNNVVLTGFEYGLTTSYGTAVAGVPGTVSYTPATDSAVITGLTPGTTYNYRAIGTSGSMIVYGSNMTFTTLGTSKALNLVVMVEGLFNNSTGVLNKAQDCTDGATSFDKFSGNIADTVMVLLANPTTPWDYVFKASGLNLNTDGTISLTVPGTYSGSYYLVVKHHSGVETWSAFPVSFAGSAISYNFTTAAGQAFGNNQKRLLPESSVYGIYSGDVTSMGGGQDGYIDIFDNNAVFNNSQSGAFGYINEDLTGDAFVDIFDMAIVFNNMQSSVGMITPPNPGKK